MDEAFEDMANTAENYYQALSLDEDAFKQKLRQEEINHPEKTVYERAFIPGWDD